MNEELALLVYSLEGNALFDRLKTPAVETLLAQMFPKPNTVEGRSHYETLSGNRLLLTTLTLFKLLEQLGADCSAKPPTTGRVDCSAMPERLVGKPERQRLLVWLFTVLPAMGFAGCAKTIYNEVVYLQFTDRSVNELLRNLLANIEPVLTAAPQTALLLKPPKRLEFDAKIEFTDSTKPKCFKNQLCDHGLFMKAFRTAKGTAALCPLTRREGGTLTPCSQSIPIS